MDADYMFSSVREIRLEKQNQQLRSNLRDAVELIDHLQTQYLECFSTKSQARIAEILHRPSVKAALSNEKEELK